MDIILASQSPRRKELLEKKGVNFRIIVSNANENIDELDPKEYVKKVSCIKAMEIFKDNKDSVVIGADTIVVLDNKILGKPKDYNDAINTLKSLNNRWHEVITGVAIISKKGIKSFYVVSKVLFRNNSEDDIIKYVDTLEPMDKAGSYAIQGLGNKLIKEYEGSLDNIIGLPVDEVIEALKNF